MIFGQATTSPFLKLIIEVLLKRKICPFILTFTKRIRNYKK